MLRRSYFIEDQINDCFNLLGIEHKDAHEMTEAELHEAETCLARLFDWVDHPGYVQAIPRHKASDRCVTPFSSADKELYE